MRFNILLLRDKSAQRTAGLMYPNGLLFFFQLWIRLSRTFKDPLLSRRSVEMTGFEPVTFALQRRRSPN